MLIAESNLNSQHLITAPWQQPSHLSPTHQPHGTQRSMHRVQPPFTYGTPACHRLALHLRQLLLLLVVCLLFLNLLKASVIRQNALGASLWEGKGGKE